MLKEVIVISEKERKYHSYIDIYKVYSVTLTAIIFIIISLFSSVPIRKQSFIFVCILLYWMPLFIVAIIQHIEISRYLRKYYFTEWKGLQDIFGISIVLSSQKALEFAKSPNNYEDSNLLKIKKEIVSIKMIRNCIMLIIVIVIVIVMFRYK